MNDQEEEKSLREIVIPGEVIVSGDKYLPGEGTRREENDIIASKFGLAEVSGRFVRVIPLAGTYFPRVGNTVIGRVTDATFNGWLIDINAAYTSFLPVSEYPRYIKGDLTEYYDIGEMIACKVIGVKAKGIDLSIKGRGLGKLEGGMIMYINSNKVPRVIGKEGSMINLIKQETNCEIIIGQNGVVWIEGESVAKELAAKEAILFVVQKSFVEGLTEKVKDFFERKK